MSRIHLKSFELPINIEGFIEKFWLNNTFYEKFLSEKLKDIGIEIGDWNESGGNGVRRRQVRSFHPAKISFPGLPSHAESLKSQTIDIGEDRTTIFIKEVTSFQGIPYSDYFHVITEWDVMNVSSGNKNSCQVKIFLDFKFLKYTWLQSTIEANTKAELMEVFDLWMDCANQYLRVLMDQRESTADGRQNEFKLRLSVDESSKALDDNSDNLQQKTTSNREETEDNFASQIDHVMSMSDADEMSFYDCEEGEKSSCSSKSANQRDINSDNELDEYENDNHGWIRNDNSFSAPGDHDHSKSITTSTPELRRYYRRHNLDDDEDHISLTNGSDRFGKSKYTSTHDIAVQFVETIFVMAEFFFWQIYQFYIYDLKTLFDVDPSQVASRIVNSFLPGWHCSVLSKPDIYGPLISVFLLPQSLLLSVETSRHGCNPTSQLGNAIVVTLLIWVCLSGLYRLLAALVAPNMQFKHCLSVIGYSFYSWNLAIISTLPLEQYKNQLSIPILLPLVIFGIPASLSQGYMFWEYTPASTLTLQPSSLPTSVQPFVNPRLLQRIMWVFPKVIAFLLVAGTHYQLLWYIARVFLPGSRQLCQLSALVQPSQYADILTQKDIRIFALKILTGKGDNE